MFKLRSGGQGGSGPAQTPSIESIRRQARHRLIGASLLVLAGIIGLPLLFDAQPRPVPVDIRIDIPDRQAAAPLALADTSSPPQVAIAPVPAEEVVSSSRPVASVVPPSTPTPPSPAPSPAVPSAPPTPSAPVAALSPASPAPAGGSKVPVAPSASPSSAPAAATVRLVVQVGAFAEEARAQEVRQRLERAGLRTYTQVANTPDGPRIRVRLGPFNSRAEAERTAEQVRQLGLPASILTL
jgi:DedD protein